MRRAEIRLLSVTLLLGFLIFFAQTKTFGLMFDGLTYAALAKNILKTGDWKMLHYGLEQYSDFFYHPPLAMWMQALIFKIFGSEESIARILPGSCAILTTLGVFLFARARYGLTAAFFSAMALITSTRYIKWGTNFYLDGILGFFCFSSFALWIWLLTETNSAKKFRDYCLATCSGLLVGCAFMTKGIVAYPIIGASLIALLLLPRIKNLILFLFYAFGAVLPIFLWITYGSGSNYLHLYLSSNFSGALFHGFNWQPWQDLYHVWWPWWPVFIIATVGAMVKFFKGDKSAALILGGASAFLLAFSANPIFLENYLTPFYPFAATVIGIQFSSWIRKDYTEKYFRFTLGLTLILATLLATVAPDVNKQKDTPVTLWIREIKTLPSLELQKINTIVYSKDSAELWLTLATILGRTNWQAIGQFAVNRPAIKNTVLVVKNGETPDPSWKKEPRLYVDGYEFYIPAAGL